MKKPILDKWFYFPIFLMSINLIIRLVNQSKIIKMFPLDYTNDWASYIAQLFFLAKCGFHQTCPYWYNGFDTFVITSPGWYFFALPFYWITKNVQIGAYLSLLAMFILSYLLIYILCKKNGLSRVKSIMFFLLFFGNALAIGDFIRLGRVVSMFPFMILIPFFTILLYYRNHKFNKYFLVFIPIYALVLISHAPETIIFSFLIIGLFLVKKHLKERLYIIGSSLAAIIVSSFWLIPFLIASTDSIITTDTYALGEVLFNAWKFEPLTFIISIIIPLALFLLFYLNWQKNKSKDYFLFYLPLLFLNLIFLLRIYPFIPLLKNIHPDIFHHFLLFFVIFFFLKLDLEKFSTNWKKMLFILFNLGVILSVTISLIHTPWFTEHTESDKETLELFDYINGRYLIYGSNGSYTYAYYSYIPIYLDLPSASGWYPHMLSVEYKQLLKDSSDTLKEKDCEGFKNSLSALNVTDILAYNEFCDSLDICNLNKKADKNNICVYSYY